VAGVVAQTVEGFGRLDVLVNCAGDFKSGSVVDMPLEDWSAYSART